MREEIVGRLDHINGRLDTAFAQPPTPPAPARSPIHSAAGVMALDSQWAVRRAERTRLDGEKLAIREGGAGTSGAANR